MASNNKQGSSTPIAIWGTAAVVVLLAVYAVHSLTRQKASVHSITVSYQYLVKLVPTNGKADLTDDFQAHAQAQGQVEEIYVKPLQHVQAGQLLLKLNDATAQATLAHAQASLLAAQLAAGNVSHGGSAEERATYDSDLNRANLQLQQDATNLVQAQKLQAQGAASQAEVSTALHRIQIDEANLQTLHSRASQRYTPGDVASANASVSDAQAAVTAARSALDNAIVRSRISGTVYYLPVSRYEYVDTGQELIDVADLSHMRVKAYFDEPDIGALAVGQPVTITWEAKPGSKWYGHVSRTPTTIIPYQNRFVGECLIDVDNPDGLESNANVNLKVTLAQHPHVLAIPRGALKFDAGGQSYVFRIRDGKVVRTNIRTGLINLDFVEVDSGLSEGETVATLPTGNVDLTNGESVTAVSGP